MRRPVVLIAAAVLLSACGSSDITGGTSGLTPPANLTYQLTPSGDPLTPESIVLRWDPVDDSRVTNYVVYSRGSSGEQWSRRGETTSASFNDLGVPDFQYQVATEASDGSESAPSNTITVDASNTLIAPGELSSISLNQAVWLSWPADSQGDLARVLAGRFDLEAAGKNDNHQMTAVATLADAAANVARARRGRRPALEHLDHRAAWR